jgi:hypothetical protein
MMDFDLRMTDRESLNTEVSRLKCETRITGICLKYNISDEDKAILVEGIAEYLKQVQDDAREAGRHR